MKQIIIEPHKKVGKIAIGMTKNKVRTLLGQPILTRENKDYYDENCFQVYYNESDFVEYLEVSVGIDADVIYNNINIFNTPANKIINEISKDFLYDPNDPELGYTYTFLQIDIALWRPVLPDFDEDEGYYFSAIGVGEKGYYST